MDMKQRVVASLALGAAGLAQAQLADLNVSVGAKVWRTQWTTFSYDTVPGRGQVVTQEPAGDKTVLIPVLSLRWHDWVGSISAFSSTDYSFIDGNGAGNTRKELDLNVGYFVTPGLALTLGHKTTRQKENPGTRSYEVSGLVAGLSGTAPLSPTLGLYGSFGVGRMKPTGSSTEKYDADYRLTEVGLAWNVPMDRGVKALNLTLGYRTQVLSSKDALPRTGQEARDLTQGFTFGLVATF